MGGGREDKRGWKMLMEGKERDREREREVDCFGMVGVTGKENLRERWDRPVKNPLLARNDVLLCFIFVM